MIAAESGLRSHVLMGLRYRHVMEDLESGTVPVAVRLEPRFYAGKKAAGYAFIGQGSARLLKEALNERLVAEEPGARLIPKSYYSIRTALYQAKTMIGLDPQIQPCHGFRKYFENCLDDANIDHEKKMIIEGHFAGTRAKHYTGRDIEQLRDIYRRAYPFIRLSLEEPVQLGQENETYNRRFASLEARLDRQRVLEARLTVLEEQLDRIRRHQLPSENP